MKSVATLRLCLQEKIDGHTSELLYFTISKANRAHAVDILNAALKDNYKLVVQENK
jgi:hypothetical protein